MLFFVNQVFQEKVQLAIALQLMQALLNFLNFTSQIYQDG